MRALINKSSALVLLVAQVGLHPLQHIGLVFMVQMNESLTIDPVEESSRLGALLREDLQGVLRRRGAVVGVSGGVDSAVVLALCVRALGAEKVLAVFLPERESSPDSLALASSFAEHLGVQTISEDITSALEGAGCYRRRDEAIQRVFPDFREGWVSKITLPGSLLEQETLNVFTLTVVNPAGEEFSKRLPNRELFQIIAASNFKQRLRMSMLYYHAELNQYAVIGTANKNEHELGFFVKYGDGGVDIALIQHLYKSQVYQLAEHLEIPHAITSRPPTSDTYSAGSTQEEFFFRLSFDVLDSIWAMWEDGAEADEIAAKLQLKAGQVQRVIEDIIRKRTTTEYLRTVPREYALANRGEG